jgi:hypothetical protein
MYCIAPAGIGDPDPLFETAQYIAAKFVAASIAGSSASVMLATGMAMRLRKTLGSSQQLRLRHSLNGFCFAHDHAGRLSAMTECAVCSWPL